MKIIIAAIEYRTPDLIDKFIDEWIKSNYIVKIYIASTTKNKFSKKPILLKEINNIEVYYVELLNNGYGRAIDELINLIRTDNQINHLYFDYLLIGNIDVYPINIIEPHFINDQLKIPIVNVIENEKNRNPFISNFQKRFLFLYKLPLKFNSIPLLYLVILIFKLLKIFKSKPWAVHGALFCFNNRMMTSDSPFFNNSFLYCEELFYARNLEKHKIQLVKSDISVKHIGGVSTGLLISKNRKRFFRFWKESMIEFFNSK